MIVSKPVGQLVDLTQQDVYRPGPNRSEQTQLVAEGFGTFPQLMPGLIARVLLSNHLKLPNHVLALSIGSPEPGADKSLPFVSRLQNGAVEPKTSTALCPAEFLYELPQHFSRKPIDLFLVDFSSDFFDKIVNRLLLWCRLLQTISAPST